MEEVEEVVVEEIYCHHCNCVIDVNEDDGNYDSDGNRYCGTCFILETFNCNDCGAIYSSDDTDSYETANGDIICYNCYINRYDTCAGCGEIFNSNHMMYDDNYDDRVCESCYDERGHGEMENGDIVIYDYHGFRDWRMLGNDSNLRFGFELEVEQQNSDVYVNTAAKKVCEIMNNDVICSHDGSLDCGFEIVSHPMTFNYLLSKQDNILEMLKYLSTSGYRSHEPKTCGLHVHVTRNALGTTMEEVDRVINNILMIFENFIEELTLFSRRAESQLDRWAQFISKYSGFNGEILSMKFISDKKNTGSRYMAVNLNNRNTIEFRLFRGTLNPNTFMATMYLLNNIIKKAQQKTINGLTWDKLIGKNKVLREYNNLRGIESNIIANELIIKFENKKPKQKLAALRNDGMYDTSEMAEDTLHFARRTQRQAQTAIDRMEYERSRQELDRPVETAVGVIDTTEWPTMRAYVSTPPDDISDHQCRSCNSVETCSLSDAREYRELTSQETTSENYISTSDIEWINQPLEYAGTVWTDDYDENDESECE